MFWEMSTDPRESGRHPIFFSVWLAPSFGQNAFLFSDTDASWSPDGQWIVYSSDYGDLPTPNVFGIPANGGDPVRITHDESRGEGAASWSPDRQWLAFESYPSPEDEETPATLWLIAAPDLAETPAPETDQAGTDWWQPGVDTTWRWELSDQPIDQSFEVDMYDIEMFDSDVATVADLHTQGRKVVCYLSAGSWEDWRPDAADFPASVLGNDYEGWPGEKWLDIRQIEQLAPIMRARSVQAVTWTPLFCLNNKFSG